MLFLGIDVSKDKLDGAAVSECTGAVLGRRSVRSVAMSVRRRPVSFSNNLSRKRS